MSRMTGLGVSGMLKAMVVGAGILGGTLGVMGHGALAQTAAQPEETRDAFTDVMPVMGLPIYSYPEKDLPTSAVVLFSGEHGWGDAEKAMARTLVQQGALVIGIDTPATLRRLDEQNDPCVEIVGEIENVSHNTQYQMDTPRYHFPVVGGIGLGGALAMAVAAQTEAATIDRFAVVDPWSFVPSRKPLCTLGDPQPKKTTDGKGYRYDLPVGPKSFSLSATLTAQADPQGKAYVADWVQANPKSVFSQSSTQSQSDALLAAVRSKAASTVAGRSASGEDVSDLPLEEIPVSTPSDTFAIFYSGDGGWRDLDKDVAAVLEQDGLPVVGVDVLRYFWTEQTPQQSAKDLARIIRSYRQKWHAKKVVLIGFSFGADLLPIMYNQLPKEERASVAQITLLGLSKAAVFEVSMESWLNHKPSDAPQTLPQLAKIPSSLVQCFYGEDDTHNVCPELAGTGVELIKTKGGHHFNNEYDMLARRILDGLKARAQQPAKAAGQ